MFHYKTTAWALAALLIGLFTACSGPGNSQQLSCTGSITPFVTVDQQGKVAPNQQIEVRISRRNISFSGNPLLSGRDVSICPPGNSGWATGGHYFDNQACASSPHPEGTRVYGTYNEISGELDLTNELAGGPYALVQGSFSCSAPGRHKE